MPISGDAGPPIMRKTPRERFIAGECCDRAKKEWLLRRYIVLGIAGILCVVFFHFIITTSLQVKSMHGMERSLLFLHRAAKKASRGNSTVSVVHIADPFHAQDRALVSECKNLDDADANDSGSYNEEIVPALEYDDLSMSGGGKIATEEGGGEGGEE